MRDKLLCPRHEPVRPSKDRAEMTKLGPDRAIMLPWASRRRRCILGRVATVTWSGLRCPKWSPRAFHSCFMATATRRPSFSLRYISHRVRDREPCGLWSPGNLVYASRFASARVRASRRNRFRFPSSHHETTYRSLSLPSLKSGIGVLLQGFGRYPIKPRPETPRS
jgi:hypothetical protein